MRSEQAAESWPGTDRTLEVLVSPPYLVPNTDWLPCWLEAPPGCRQRSALLLLETLQPLTPTAELCALMAEQEDAKLAFLGASIHAFIY